MEFLTTKQVAELLSVSERTVREWATEGRTNPIPCMRLSARVLRFERQAVEKWAASVAVSVATSPAVMSVSRR